MTDKNELMAHEHAPPPAISEDQVALIKRTVADGTTNDELKLFLYQAARTGLDPLSGQIHMIVRGSEGRGNRKATIQIGIDGFRAIADETGLYAGAEDHTFNGGMTIQQVLDSGQAKPQTATATVYKLINGERTPFSSTVRWDEYYPSNPKQRFMWDTKAFTMLGKCAEACVLRRAFPRKLSNLYEHAEMDQAGPAGAGEEWVEPPPKIAPAPKQAPSEPSEPYTGGEAFQERGEEKKYDKPYVETEDLEYTDEPVPKEYWKERDKSFLGAGGLARKHPDTGGWVIARKKQAAEPAVEPGEGTPF